MSNKQTLMGIFIQMLFMHFYTFHSIIIIVAANISKGFFKSNCVSLRVLKLLFILIHTAKEHSPANAVRVAAHTKIVS